MTQWRFVIVAVLATLVGSAAGCRATTAAPARAGIDGDLLDVTVPKLRQLYADKKYTVAQVVQWHLDRIDRYNGVYGAIETVYRREALADAAREDREAVSNAAARGLLWGVPIVIK